MYFDQEWSKRRKNHLDDFKEQSNNIFPYRALGLLSLSILRLWSPFFPIEYPAHISCSFVRSNFLFICKVYTGVFWSRMEWKKKRKKPTRSFQPIGLTADANLNYVDKSMYSGHYFSLCTTPAILTEIKCMI